MSSSRPSQDSPQMAQTHEVNNIKHNGAGSPDLHGTLPTSKSSRVVAPFEWMDEPKTFLYKDVEASASTTDLLHRVESEVLKNYKVLRSQPSSFDLGSILPYFTEAVEAVAKHFLLSTG